MYITEIYVCMCIIYTKSKLNTRKHITWKYFFDYFKHYFCKFCIQQSCYDEKHIARTVQSYYIVYTNHVNYLMVKIKLTYTCIPLYKNSIFLCRLHYATVLCSYNREFASACTANHNALRLDKKLCIHNEHM